MNENWGLQELAAYIRKESIEEMMHAQQVIDPSSTSTAANMSKYMKINVGKDVPKVPERPRGRDQAVRGSTGHESRGRSATTYRRCSRPFPQGRRRARGLARGAKLGLIEDSGSRLHRPSDE